MAKRVAVLIFTLVLLAPHLAEAACACVLWIKHDTVYGKKEPPSLESSTTRWELQRAYGTQSECDLARQRTWSVVSDAYADLSKWKGINKVRRVPYEAIFIELKESDWLHYGYQNQHFSCLPDTIDPRGPKGSSQ